MPRSPSSSVATSEALQEREALVHELTELVEKEALRDALVACESPMDDSLESDHSDEASEDVEAPYAPQPKKLLPAPATPILNHWNQFQAANDLSCVRDLVHVCVAHQRLRNHDLALLCHNLSAFVAMKTLDASHNQLDDGACNELRALLNSKRPRLLGLNLACNLLGENAFQLVCERLAANVSLVWLNILGNAFTYSATSVPLLRDALYMNESLESLAVSLGDFENPATSFSAGPRRKHRLAKDFVRGLGFHSKHLRDAQFGPTPIRKQLSVAALSLANAELSTVTVSELMGVLQQQPQLTALDLSYCFVGIAGARILAHAIDTQAGFPLLTLQLKCNHIGSAGALALVDALQSNTTLTALGVDKNEISNDGIVALAKYLPRLPCLTRLSLAQNHCRASGLAALTHALAASPQLTDLGALSR
ncbi:hypothetical protein SPRG_20374 [Saprolegnia parasitica CBS 223.65]|uniref:Uncharacterized protein n=1 Tax=Saprolegnia parasitica (strain CBS 223.65) TaxID=695850 RepID=A0A067CMI5_SAPPC|nr:hypothetical protein SPRG_20374 [Saprolegnia parasitica CBS 223.65]KDO27731.1 hypothetical protein SPRG_20374 [Saprolegnia parasitica CBS 223.65]|eukprot:XP_012201604.1 hypothetical protein SPRG_20374 [Saprolegnia parasitica CBS 223.65]